MRTGPVHGTYAKATAGSGGASTADRVLEGVETAGKIYSAAQTAYGIARGGAAVAARLAPLLGLL